MQRPEVKIRFASQKQKKLIVKAAVIRKWSFNQFVIDAAEQVAASTVSAAQSVDNSATGQQERLIKSAV